MYVIVKAFLNAMGRISSFESRSMSNLTHYLFERRLIHRLKTPPIAWSPFQLQRIFWILKTVTSLPDKLWIYGKIKIGQEKVTALQQRVLIQSEVWYMRKFRFGGFRLRSRQVIHSCNIGIFILTANFHTYINSLTGLDQDLWKYLSCTRRILILIEVTIPSTTLKVVKSCLNRWMERFVWCCWSNIAGNQWGFMQIR